MVLFVFIEAKGVMNLISASLIAKRKGRTFTYVTAALNCLNIPFGLALAIFTFIVMGDKEVRMEYGLTD
jgi:F0F1-type ATP synthase membrane subunit a